MNYTDSAVQNGATYFYVTTLLTGAERERVLKQLPPYPN